MTVAELLIHYISFPAWLAYSIAAAVQCGLLLAIALGSAAVGIWLERKVSARIQDRLGPTRVGGRFGWLQPPADGLKLICKEDIIPTAADRLLFRLAPYISFCSTFCVFLALPFANGWVAVELNAGAFFLLAVEGLEIFGVILGGYASGSKWSLYGAMREAAQVVSYEIPLGLCVLVVIILTGSMNLVEIGNRQQGWVYNWFIFHDPFTFVTFWVYVTSAVASTNRAPFDLPEAESELVAGFLTEYSGFRWVFFFMGEYAAMFVVSGLGALALPGRLERARADRLAAGPDAAARRTAGLARQPAGDVQLHRQGVSRHDVHDRAPLDAAPAAGGPGDHHLPEILRADRLRDAGRRDAVDLFPARRTDRGVEAACVLPACRGGDRFPLVPTLRVGTHCPDAPRDGAGDGGAAREATWRQSLPAMRSHAEHGNKVYSREVRR